MARIEDHVVGQRHEDVAHGVEQLLGQVLGPVIAQQVGAADAVDEERIARQHAPRRFGVAVEQQVGHVLGRVAGREARRHAQAAEGERVAIAHGLVREAVFGAAFRADKQLGLTAQPVDQFARAAHEIGVDMGLEHVGYDKAEAPGRFQVDLDIRAGIDHRTDMGRVVAQQIRAFGDAIGQDLLETQGHRCTSSGQPTPGSGPWFQPVVPAPGGLPFGGHAGARGLTLPMGRFNN